MFPDGVYHSTGADVLSVLHAAAGVIGLIENSGMTPVDRNISGFWGPNIPGWSRGRIVNPGRRPARRAPVSQLLFLRE
jgi:hypothetical protein